MADKIAFITGVTGQDGAYLAEFLLKKGYEVHGVKRRSSSFNTGRVDHLYLDPHLEGVNFFMHYGDMTDATNLIRLVQSVKPTEIYNLAAQSHVQVSFETPEYTANSDALGTLRLLEAIRILGMEKRARFYQASTSELFGNAQESPQNESTPLKPDSVYGETKAEGVRLCREYRTRHSLFASAGILYTHESHYRQSRFVSRKIVEGALAIKEGKSKELVLGDLAARRDWGWAPDTVNAMHAILGSGEPGDFVVATGETHSVSEFAQAVFAELGLNWKDHVREDPALLRRDRVTLVGDASKLRDATGWKPSVDFQGMIRALLK